MQFPFKVLAFLLAFSAVFAAAPAEAQVLRIGARGAGSHGSISVELGWPARTLGTTCRRPYRADRAVWSPGHYEQVPHQVWVPGATRQVWVPAVLETRCDYDGRPIQVVVRAGTWTTVQEPGCYVTRYATVWVPGRWSRFQR